MQKGYNLKREFYARARKGKFMLKKYSIWGIVGLCLLVGACRQQIAYDRNDPDLSYEKFINSHVFAACENVGQPYARYSLAKLLVRPSKNSDYYKITFTNGPCQGQTVWTTDIILKTQPVEDASLLTAGTVVLRNFDNPKEPYDKDLTDHWNVGVVMDTSRTGKGIVDLGFPRDRNDFFPARESSYIHNVRYIVQPKRTDVRHFL